MDDLSIGEAARELGVSVDTLRRWDRTGRLVTVRDDRNRRRVPAAEIERLRPSHAPGGPEPNRFAGIVRSIDAAGAIAVVDIESGSHRFQAAVPREVVRRLGLAPGAGVTASVAAAAVILST